MGAAQDIAKQINIPWVTPSLVQFFMTLSGPVRVLLHAYLDSMIDSLEIEKGTLVALSLTGNKLSEKISAIRMEVNTVLDPINNILKVIPLDVAIAGLPVVQEFSSILKTAADSVPLKIPATQATIISGLGGFDFLDGISSFKDLQNKLDELNFRLARATALSNYANTASFLIDQQIDKLRAYISIIVTLGG